LLAH
jgi:hypothetical protein